MSERDELARVIDGATDAWLYPVYGAASVQLSDAIIKAGYRQIFDGDCGLSNVKDPTDREASEAWMRWANLIGGGHDGIGAMKQMLTELGYRKPTP